jgi:amino acid transporter
MGGGEELSAFLGLAAAFALLIVAFIGVWRLSDLISESLSLNASIRAKAIISLIIVLLGYGAIGSVGKFALSEWASASRACPNTETQSDQQ